MPETIDRNALRSLLEKEGAQLVEVLPEDEYESIHISGAVNLPLKALDPESVKRLDPARPVVVYCHDYQ